MKLLVRLDKAGQWLRVWRWEMRIKQLEKVGITGRGIIGLGLLRSGKMRQSR